MAVTSTPTARPEPIVIRRTGYEPGAIIGALIGILIGMVIWLFGARYTIDGLVLGCNMILAFFRSTYRVELTTELYLYLALFPVGFSIVEWTCSPLGKSGVRNPFLIATWAIVVLIDMATTAIGLRAGGGIPLIVWIAASNAGVGALALVLTFGPETLIKGCAALLGRAMRSLFKR